jgi:hypothetical protein
MSIENISIIGTGIFEEDSQNGGIVDNGIFQDSSTNSGTVSTASFSGTSINSGTVSIATFEESSLNSGSITESASFSDTTVNTGSISGTVTFSGSASNTGGTIEGNAVFSDTTVNTGTVSQAVFIGSSSNTGIITLSASFSDTSINSGTVEGDAIFSDSTTNTGTIEGNAQIAATADNSSGTVSGSVTVYVQPDGYFANGYYNGGVKTAPPNYDTVVYQVGNVWYKYDASGNGSLATGNYSDGTSTFTFNNGVKGAAYVPECLPEGTIIRTDTIYADILGINYAVAYVDIFADGNCGETQGTLSYVANGTLLASMGGHNYYSDGAGSYYSCLVSGTFIRTDIINVTIGGNSYQVGTVEINADGTCGETQGTPSYTSNGTFIVEFEGNNYYSDGAGSYYTVPV